MNVCPGIALLEEKHKRLKATHDRLKSSHNRYVAFAQKTQEELKRANTRLAEQVRTIEAERRKVYASYQEVCENYDKMKALVEEKIERCRK
jgi:hypothetical protein